MGGSGLFRSISNACLSRVNVDWNYSGEAAGLHLTYYRPVQFIFLKKVLFKMFNLDLFLAEDYRIFRTN